MDVSLPISPLDAQFFTDIDTVVETYMDHKVMNVQLKFCPGTKFKTIGSKPMVGWSHTPLAHIGKYHHVIALCLCYRDIVIYCNLCKQY